MSIRAIIGLSILIFPTTVATVRGATGREILDQAKRLDDTTRHWDDSVQSVIIRIFAATGGERLRELMIKTKRYAGDEDKRISVFLSPAEMKGTGLLQWVHKGHDDDQWLYLPAFKRTRQISAGIRDESFVGTDFSYRDLEVLGKFLRWTEAEARTRLLEEPVEVGGASCHRIELEPKQEGTPYGRIVVAMERERLIARRLDFHDRSGSLVKSLALEDVRDVGRVPTPHRWEIKNLKEGSRTVVEVQSISYDSGLGDELFTLRQLEHGSL